MFQKRPISPDETFRGFAATGFSVFFTEYAVAKGGKVRVGHLAGVLANEFHFPVKQPAVIDESIPAQITGPKAGFRLQPE